MKPYEIFKTLRSKRTEKAMLDVLKTVPDGNEFWLCAHYALLPFGEWKVKLSFTNPEYYGAGVPEGIFTKIIEGMEAGKLSPEETVYAFSKFSQACSKTEWKEWYLPTLERRLVLPFGADLFNMVCPEKYWVTREWEPVPHRLITASKKLPREFFIEPIHQKPLTYWFCDDTDVRTFNHDGTEFFHKISEELGGITKGLHTGLVLVGYIDNDILVLSDVFPTDEMLRCDGPTSLKFKVRQELLENIVGKLDSSNIDIIESYPCERSDEEGTRNEINLLFQQGHDGILIRDANGGCDYPDILVHPTIKSVITCTEIEPGAGYYADKAEFISGRGVLQKKKIQINAFFGLTLSEREQYLKNSDDFIGSRFEILSCGMRQNSNEVLFPVFKQWRNKQ